MVPGTGISRTGVGGGGGVEAQTRGGVWRRCTVRQGIVSGRRRRDWGSWLGATGELGPPDPAEDAVQVPLHVHQGASVVHEALAHLLQPHAGQVVEVQKHLVGFLKAVQPRWGEGEGPA